ASYDRRKYPFCRSAVLRRRGRSWTCLSRKARPPAILPGFPAESARYSIRASPVEQNSGPLLGCEDIASSTEFRHWQTRLKVRRAAAASPESLRQSSTCALLRQTPVAPSGKSRDAHPGGYIPQALPGPEGGHTSKPFQ